MSGTDSGGRLGRFESVRLSLRSSFRVHFDKLVKNDEKDSEYAERVRGQGQSEFGDHSSHFRDLLTRQDKPASKFDAWFRSRRFAVSHREEWRAREDGSEWIMVTHHARRATDRVGVAREYPISDRFFNLALPIPARDAGPQDRRCSRRRSYSSVSPSRIA